MSPIGGCQPPSLMFSNFNDSGDPLITSHRFIFSQLGQSAQHTQELPSLTEVVHALEKFQNFDPEIKAAGTALFASQLATQHGWSQETAELKLFWVSLRAGLGGVS